MGEALRQQDLTENRAGHAVPATQFRVWQIVRQEVLQGSLVPLLHLMVGLERLTESTAAHTPPFCFEIGVCSAHGENLRVRALGHVLGLDHPLMRWAAVMWVVRNGPAAN
jgi:hypothetical protein